MLLRIGETFSLEGRIGVQLHNGRSGRRRKGDCGKQRTAEINGQRCEYRESVKL